MIVLLEDVVKDFTPRQRAQVEPRTVQHAAAALVELPIAVPAANPLVTLRRNLTTPRNSR